VNGPRYAAAAARFLAQRIARRSGSLAGGPIGDRARGIDTIERAMRGRARRRRLLSGVALLAASAALVSLWFVARSRDDRELRSATVSIHASPAESGASLKSSGRGQALESSSVLRSGDAIETAANGGARLELSTGTRLALSGLTAFRIDNQGPTERFALTRGEVTAHVAKLSPGERFIIETPDAEIEVRGTQFRLRVLAKSEPCAVHSRTRLEVVEGVVDVRSGGHGVRVSAGQSWPADCMPREFASAAARESAPPAAGRAAGESGMPSSPSSGVIPASKPKLEGPAGARSANSALTRQNDLFAEAVALRRHGDTGGALRAYEALIVQFPSSPLVENAMVERMRLLVGSDRARARGEAERYLARYPQGFAVDDARHVLGSP